MEARGRVDLSRLATSIESFEAAGRRFTEAVGLALRAGPPAPDLVRRVNRGLLDVERNWLDPAGLPGRPWFGHTLYAARYTYAHLELPGITEGRGEGLGSRRAPGGDSRARGRSQHGARRHAGGRARRGGGEAGAALIARGVTLAFRYVILGSGRQGTAAAYDLVRYGDAARVLMADASEDAARRAAACVNDLVGRDIADAAVVDASDAASLRTALVGASVALAAELQRQLEG